MSVRLNGLGGAALALAGFALGMSIRSGHAQQQAPALRAPTTAETITLDLPSMAHGNVQSGAVEYNLSPRESAFRDSTTVTWGDGYRLTARNAVVRFRADRGEHPVRIYIEPLPSRK